LSLTIPILITSYFQGPIKKWSCPDQRLLRNVIPENRLRAYDIREVLHTMADTDSVLELRPQFGLGMITAFIRIEGRPIAVVANNSWHLGGAIAADEADKAARFMQLADAFELPILALCDTPGFMVGFSKLALGLDEANELIGTGRTGTRKDCACPSRLEDDGHRRLDHRSLFDGRLEERIRARGAGNGCRFVPRTSFECFLANGRVWRDGT
jgi:hypothetical protein